MNHITIQGNHLSRPLDILMHSVVVPGSPVAPTMYDWKVINNTGGRVSGNPQGGVMFFDHVNGLEVHGNYQKVNDWRPMVGAVLLLLRGERRWKHLPDGRARPLRWRRHGCRSSGQDNRELLTRPAGSPSRPAGPIASLARPRSPPGTSSWPR